MLLGRSTVDINGVQIAYSDSGGDDRPFVLVHGFTGTRHDFEDHYTRLCELGRTVLYDHRGHGESTNTGDPSTYSFRQLTDDLGSFLDALEIGSCDLLGHSMGGMVALRFVLGHPERVDSLILMDTSPRAPDGFTRNVFTAGGEVARRDGMETLAEVTKAMSSSDPKRTAASKAFQARIGDDAYWRRHRYRMTSMDAEAFAMLGIELCDQDPVSDRLHEIRCPTTIIVGEEDTPFIRASQEMNSAIEGSLLVVIEEAAHSPQLENPQPWLAAIEQHLCRVRV